MKHFKELTVSHPVIMGRKTGNRWGASTGRCQPRQHRRFPRSDVPCAGGHCVTSLDDALDMARQEAIPDDGLDRSEIWIIGGAQLFAKLCRSRTKPM